MSAKLPPHEAEAPLALPIMSVTLSSNMPLSSRASSRREEDLINAFEYEEERITNSLVSKLEQVKVLPWRQDFEAELCDFAIQLRNEKIQLENTLEAESEAQVNRLSRQITALRQVQNEQSLQAGTSGSSNAPPRPLISSESSASGARRQLPAPLQTPVALIPEPNTSAIVEALRRENDSLRSRLWASESPEKYFPESERLCVGARPSAITFE